MPRMMNTTSQAERVARRDLDGIRIPLALAREAVRRQEAAQVEALIRCVRLGVPWADIERMVGAASTAHVLGDRCREIPFTPADIRLPSVFWCIHLSTRLGWAAELPVDTAKVVERIECDSWAWQTMHCDRHRVTCGGDHK